MATQSEENITPEQERIDRANQLVELQKQNPNTPFFTNYSQVFKKPEPQIDEAQASRMRKGAAISDSFATLAQMFAANKGAHISKNDPNQAATPKIDARIQYMQDKYDKDLLDHNTGLYNANMKDFAYGVERADKATAAAIAERNYEDEQNKYNKEEERKDQAFDYTKSKDAVAQGNVVAKMEQDDKRITADNNLKVIAQTETERNNKENNRIGWANANRERNKATFVNFGFATNKDKDGKQTVPVMIKGKQYNFPADLVDKVVSNAIKNGQGGSIEGYALARTGKTVKTNIPVTATSKLDPLQRKAIFDKVSSQFIDVSGSKFTIKQNLSDYDKQTSKPSHEKVVKTNSNKIDPSKYGGKAI